MSQPLLQQNVARSNMDDAARTPGKPKNPKSVPEVTTTKKSRRNGTRHRDDKKAAAAIPVTSSVLSINHQAQMMGANNVPRPRTAEPVVSKSDNALQPRKRKPRSTQANCNRGDPFDKDDTADDVVIGNIVSQVSTSAIDSRRRSLAEFDVNPTDTSLA
ncbi:unnamed protein product [Alternaria sp. RS040]